MEMEQRKKTRFSATSNDSLLELPKSSQDVSAASLVPYYRNMEIRVSEPNTICTDKLLFNSRLKKIKYLLMSVWLLDSYQ